MRFCKLEWDSLTTAQFAQMIAIEENCGLEPYSPAMLQECIETLDTYAYLDGERIAGFITVHPYSRKLGGGLYIANLNVAQGYRRQGIGTSLMLTACARYKGIHAGSYVTLDVEKTNTAAIHLYQKLGFMITDIPSGNGDTDMVMAASFDHLITEKIGN